MFFDFYEYLELKSDCTQAEINTKIKELQIIYHPDRRKENDTIAKTAIRILNEANEKIGTAQARKEYNKEYKKAQKEAKKSINRQRNSGSVADNNIQSFVKNVRSFIEKVGRDTCKQNKKEIDKIKHSAKEMFIEEGLKFIFGNKQADSRDNKCDTDDKD